MIVSVVVAASIKLLFATCEFSRVVRKSKVYVWHARMQRKLNNTKYCLFYNRFGKHRVLIAMCKN